MCLLRRIILVTLLVSSLAQAAQAELVVVDMAGRSVRVPDRINRTATIGMGPVLDSFIAALGVGGTLVNGMPVSARMRQADCCRYLPRVLPGLLALPALENTSFEVNRELLLALRPDVVLGHNENLMPEAGADAPAAFVVRLVRERQAIPVEAMTALGELYGAQARADAYRRHFEGMLARVNKRLAGLHDAQRVRAIYFNHGDLSQSSVTADWWIETAGGVSVTRSLVLKGGRAAMTIEQLLAWDPQVIFAATPNEVQRILDDSRLSGIAAVRDRRIHPVPRSVIRWAHPSPEQAIGVLWAAQKLYPERFLDAEPAAELRAFYRDFYRVELGDAELRDILHLPPDAPVAASPAATKELQRQRKKP